MFRFLNHLRPALALDEEDYKLILRGDGVDTTPSKPLHLSQVDHFAWKPSCIELFFYIRPLQFEDERVDAYWRQQELRNWEEFEPGSWREMYFSQPPVLDIRWRAEEGWREFEDGEEPEVLCGVLPAGTRLGDLREEGKRLGW